ncbi:amidase [Coprinellus micaceus]|uniref:amidase n=1 Tax=Coprinellus micaceus TaxID=71717 RepID=A0A4Y7T4F7_COPMI|nr:amidase [Coprinellus micaceus]
MWPFTTSNTDIIVTKRDERDIALAAAGSAVAEDHSQYLTASATTIVSRIAAGEWTATDVLEAYIGRAVLAHSKTNCLTEVFFDKARARAKALDDEFARTGKVSGPLHGVPISIKDQFEIEGVDLTIGFTQWANNPSTTNADLITHLLAAGAVLFVKTNVPQTMLAFECSNPLWGRTINPYSPNYSSGGSSGGEGALLAMDGSALGIGTDIGGSLRIPAAYCGIYSLKPGSGRVSYVGARGPVGGFEGIKTVAGPMARSVDDVVLLSRALLGKPSALHDVPPVPFKEVSLPSKLKFGYYTSDGYVKASPACKRAVLETVEALKKQGHECVEISIPDTATGFNLFVALTSSDGYKTLLSHLGPDKKESSLFLSTLGPKLPAFVRSFAGWAIESVVGDKIFADTLRASTAKSVGEYWALTSERDDFTKEWYQEVWNDTLSLDGVLAPVQALPQLPHGGCDNFSALAVGTILYNVLDMPVGCLPVTRVDAKKDQITEEWEQEEGHGTKIMEKGVYYGAKKLYDPELSNGLPVNIQIVGKRWEDEKVLALMKVVDGALGINRGFGPGAWDQFQEAQLKV